MDLRLCVLTRVCMCMYVCSPPLENCGRLVYVHVAYRFGKVRHRTKLRQTVRLICSIKPVKAML